MPCAAPERIERETDMFCVHVKRTIWIHCHCSASTGEEDTAQRMGELMPPGRAHVCMDTTKLPVRSLAIIASVKVRFFACAIHSRLGASSQTDGVCMRVRVSSAADLQGNLCA
jgi:hypothetical protein